MSWLFPYFIISIENVVMAVGLLFITKLRLGGIVEPKTITPIRKNNKTGFVFHKGEGE